MFVGAKSLHQSSYQQSMSSFVRQALQSASAAMQTKTTRFMSMAPNANPRLISNGPAIRNLPKVKSWKKSPARLSVGLGLAPKR
jgi:hypothetical protein